MGEREGGPERTNTKNKNETNVRALNGNQYWRQHFVCRTQQERSVGPINFRLGSMATDGDTSPRTQADTQAECQQIDANISNCLFV